MKSKNVFHRYAMVFLTVFCFSSGLLIAMGAINVLFGLESPPTISFESYLLVIGFTMLGLFEASKK